MNKTLPIQEWHQMAMDGSAPPVRISLMGESMSPLVRYNRDKVTIVPIRDELRIGDIVLFMDKSRKHSYVVHRIWKMDNQRVLTWGDNCPGPDGWLPMESIWGKVVLIERGQKTIVTDPKKGMRWARLWHLAGKVYRPCLMCKIKTGERIRRLCGVKK